MAVGIEKRGLMRAVQARLGEEIRILQEAADATRLGATHPESRPENDKDTRGLEASYLARGQAARVEQMTEAATRLRFLTLRDFGADDPIDLSALVRLRVDEEPRWVFLVPVQGGLEIQLPEARIQLITPAAPVGRSLIGRRQGEEFELRIGSALRLYEIEEVR
ncbi:MAG: GreA/GreB family elongation factor [Myxococcales bacterium]|nr:GreA/GreB family elongation factor [Myxococcales bacterium]